MVDHQAQAAATEFVRCEASHLAAAAATIAVTDTNRPPQADQPVVLFDFGYSGGGKQFDTLDVLLREERGSRANRTSFLLFSCANFPPRKDKGAGFQIQFTQAG